MVLTKSELLAALQNEVRILLHLAGKVDRDQLDYRPTPKQRSTLELLQYLSMMGPGSLQFAKSATFDLTVRKAAEEAAAARDFDQTLAAIAAHSDVYASLLADMSDADLRAEPEAFGIKITRGAYIVTYVLGGCVAYRMQLFLYLKASGRGELSTMNLWAGVDPPAV